MILRIAMLALALGAASIALGSTADASRCPPGYHWDEWSKTCRAVR
jgi:hypothetical protein